METRTFTVTITGHPAPDVDDVVTNLTFVHPDWGVTAVRAEADEGDAQPDAVGPSA
jgi:hypothetical protein